MGDADALLPWQQPDWTRLAAYPERLHHAVLLTGPSGIGKREFSQRLAQAIVCSGASVGQARPCGACQDCRLFVAGTHPDVHVLMSEREAVQGRVALLGQYAERYQDVVARDKKVNPAMVIPVDQIRRLIDQFYQASHISSHRVALIAPADRMNVNAANALLKLLEEPPENASFLLVTADPAALPATIRSRCIVETLSSPTADASAAWLADQLGQTGVSAVASVNRTGPLDQLTQIESGYVDQMNQNIKGVLAMLNGRADPVELAGLMAKQDSNEVLSWIQQFSAELISWLCSGQPPPWQGVEHLPANMNTFRLFSVYDKISSYRRLAREQLNGQLALEEILIGLRAATRSKRD